LALLTVKKKEGEKEGNKKPLLVAALLPVGGGKKLWRNFLQSDLCAERGEKGEEKMGPHGPQLGAVESNEKERVK